MPKAYAHVSIANRPAAEDRGPREQAGEDGHRLVEAPHEDAPGQSRAVGKSLRRLACFFVLLVALFFVMNALIGAGLREVKTSSYGAWNQVMQGKVNADIVISGSSRAAYHFDPRVIEAVTDRTAFNIGRPGSQTDVQVAVLRAYLEHNRKPALIVHSLDAFSFVASRGIYDPALYVPYLGDKAIYAPLLRIDPNLVRSRYIPLYGYVVDDMNFTWIEGLKALVGISPRQDYFLGFSPRDFKWGSDFANFKADNPHGASFAIEPAGVQAVEQLIQLCQANGVPLLLVYSPEYAGMQRMTNNRAQIFAEFQDLADRYHVPLWDYSNWTYDNDRAFFYNSQHLNATGAALFSADLAGRLKTYLEDHPAPGASFDASESVAHENPDRNPNRN